MGEIIADEQEKRRKYQTRHISDAKREEAERKIGNIWQESTFNVRCHWGKKETSFVKRITHLYVAVVARICGVIVFFVVFANLACYCCCFFFVGISYITCVCQQPLMDIMSKLISRNYYNWMA